MKVLPRCGICQPDADAASLMDGALEAVCGHCGAVARRHRRWKPDGAGIVIADDVFICTPPGEQAATEVA